MVDQEAQNQVVVVQAAAFPGRSVSAAGWKAPDPTPKVSRRDDYNAGSTWPPRFANSMNAGEAVGQLPQTSNIRADIAPRRRVVSVKVLWGLRILAVTLLAVGAAQWAIAAEVRSKAIKIDEWWYEETHFSTAGETQVGVMGVVLGLWMLAWAFSASSMAIIAPLAWVPPLVVMGRGVFLSVYEHAVYDRLSDFVKCTDAPNPATAVESCLCFEEPIVYGDASATTEEWTGGSTLVYRSSAVGCEDIPGVSDDVLASLVLIWIVNSLAVLAIVGGFLSWFYRRTQIIQ